MNERIKELRKSLGFTQEEFARRIGVKRNTVATYEMGRSRPVDSVVSLICKTFYVSELWLRTGQGDMKDNILPLDSNVLLIQQYADPDSPVGRALIRFLELFDQFPRDEQEVIEKFIDKLLSQKEPK